MTKAQLIDHLREFASMLEQIDGECQCEPSVSIHSPAGESPDSAKERLAIFARVLSRLYGVVTKYVAGTSFWLTHDGENPLSLTVFAARDVVCRRVVTGMIEIPASSEIIVPAQPAHSIEQVEWICDGAVLAPAEEETAVSS